MTTPIATKRLNLPPIEQADRTLELDLRGLDTYESKYHEHAPAKGRPSHVSGDDPTLVLDLTATQVRKLISGGE